MLEIKNVFFSEMPISIRYLQCYGQTVVWLKLL